MVFQETIIVDEVACQKPSVDFFKDIFLDDSDDETLIVQSSLKSEEVSTNSNEKELHSTNISIKKENKAESSAQSSTTFNLFPPRGIFANLDFDILFDTPNKNNKNENEHSTINQTNNTNKLYGPLLPENLSSSSVNIKIENSFADDDWVEKSESPTNVSSNKNKHSKHKKHKHKHKSKKKSHKH